MRTTTVPGLHISGVIPSSRAVHPIVDRHHVEPELAHDVALEVARARDVFHGVVLSEGPV